MEPSVSNRNRWGALVAPLASAAAVVAGITWAAGAPSPHLVEHSSAAPYAVDNNGHSEITFAERLERENPEIVILGSSITATAVNADVFESLVGRSTLDLTIPGGMSATWYLLMKNRIAKAPVKPKLVILGYRIVYLTVPEFRADGRYTAIIDRYVDGPEPLLDRRAYLHRLSGPDVFLRTHWAPFQRRDELKTAAEHWASRSFAGRLLGAPPEAMKAAVDGVFADAQMNQAKLNEAQQRAEQVDTTAYFDFETEKNRSFLPEIVRIAQENDIQLVFLRMRTRYDAETPEMQAKYPAFLRDLSPVYDAAQNQYLEEEGVLLFDFTKDKRIPLRWFAAGDHLDFDAGREGFTHILAEELRPIIESL